MKEVLIHQSLHGYSEGHRLLGSSIKLADDFARLMLRMSDLSGGSVFQGFEEYLTGYPLAPLDLYVFAKTWYAAEMPRPGCVWTHSLILQSKDLNSIPALERLNEFFIPPRPSKSQKFTESYGKPIVCDSENLKYFTSSEEVYLDTNFRALVNSLYYLKRRNLLVAAASSTTFETSILRLWSQQWPALRTNFSFCTGALSSRGFAGKPFDVQCAPPQLIREITTSALAKQSQEMSLLNTDETVPDEYWIDCTVADAAMRKGGEFRRLLWSLADGGRLEDFNDFASLVVLLLSKENLSLRELIKKISERFPDTSSGTAIKNRLFGEDRTNVLGANFSELEILSELAVSEAYGAFDSESLNMRSRANRLCKASQEDAEHLITKLFSGPINPIGGDVLAGLLEAINPEIARRITSHKPHFLPTLFRAKPELGTSAELWRIAGDNVRELFGSLASTDSLSEERITAISEAILSGGAETIVRRALDKWGRPAVFGILNYLVSSGKELSETVMGTLTFNTESVVEWLTTDTNRPLFAKVICAHIVAPYSYQIKQFGTQIWLQTYEELRLSGNHVEANYFASLLLALGLQNAPPTPVRVTSLFFQNIHQLTWDNRMPNESWTILNQIVPHIYFGAGDWDKCERLRRGLIEAFVKFGWPRESLCDCAKSDDLLSRVLQSANRVDGGYEYFRDFNSKL